MTPTIIPILFGYDAEKTKTNYHMGLYLQIITMFVLFLITVHSVVKDGPNN